MKFFCCVDKLRPGAMKSSARDIVVLIVDAESEADARQFAERRLGKETLVMNRTGDAAVADVELRWVSAPDRHQELRERPHAGQWSDWAKL